MIGKQEKSWTHINYYTGRIVVSNPNANHHAYVINLYTLYSCSVGGMSLGRKDYIIDEDGYYRFPNSGMLVHRWVAEKHVVGRKLLPGEVVHHKKLQ